MVLALALVTAVVPASARAEEGGYKDPATRLVWSPSILSLGDTLSTWDWADTYYAPNYAVWDVNASGVLTYYDDWRLPTVKELQKAIADGTIEAVNRSQAYTYTTSTYLFWSSDSKGTKAYAVSVKFDATGHVTGGGQAVNLNKASAIDAFLVRP
jgi:hypothetical protein